MKDLKEISSNYAMEKSNDFFSQVVAQAFADGYRQGYKDREDELPVELRENKTEYVDLGLPSGTLWSSTFEKNGNDLLFIPLKDALNNCIPTIDQCLELFNCCRFQSNNGNIFCIGPNGKTITFPSTWYKEIGHEEIVPHGPSFFWINNNEDNQTDNAAAIGCFKSIWHETREMFSGYKLPIRLVKTK